MSHSSSIAPPPPIVALVGWLLPGLGYWLIGHRARALTVGITIIVLFVSGVLVGGVRVVDAPQLTGDGPNPVARVLQKPWFIGQALTGPIGLAAAWGSRVVAADPAYKNIVSHGRLAEIGTLYTAIAGMLNLLAIIDASHRAAKVEESK